MVHTQTQTHTHKHTQAHTEAVTSASLQNGHFRAGVPNLDANGVLGGGGCGSFRRRLHACAHALLSPCWAFAGHWARESITHQAWSQTKRARCVLSRSQQSEPAITTQFPCSPTRHCSNGTTTRAVGAAPAVRNGSRARKTHGVIAYKPRNTAPAPHTAQERPHTERPHTERWAGGENDDRQHRITRVGRSGVRTSKRSWV